MPSERDGFEGWVGVADQGQAAANERGEVGVRNGFGFIRLAQRSPG